MRERKKFLEKYEYDLFNDIIRSSLFGELSYILGQKSGKLSGMFMGAEGSPL